MLPLKILIATGNEGKKREMIEFFSHFSQKINFLSLSDFPEIREPEENGKTFEENALIKALSYGDHFNVPTLGEDSGLILSAFPDKFGLRTRREIEASSDEEWLNKFLKLLEGVKNRQAIFYSAMAFYDPQTKKEVVFLGESEGCIMKSPESEIEKGVPVSALFKAKGLNHVFSALSKNEKNKVSHRGKSAQMMGKFLEGYICQS